jgi:predicted neuraminidase
LKLFGAAAEVAILPSASFKDNWLLEEQSYSPPFHQWRLLVATSRSASGNHTLPRKLGYTDLLITSTTRSFILVMLVMAWVDPYLHFASSSVLRESQYVKPLQLTPHREHGMTAYSNPELLPLFYLYFIF